MTTENRMYNDHLREMIRQARQGSAFARLSPFVLYASVSEAVAGTGVFRVKAAWDDINRYREDLLSFLAAQAEPDRPRLIYLYVHGDVHSKQSVDPDRIPRFQERRRSVTECIAAVPVDVGLLILLNVILFMAAYLSFMRADVR